MIREKPLKKSLSLLLTTALIFSSIATLFILPPAISTGDSRTAATGCVQEYVETTLIIDSSGSMDSNDPSDLRKSAAKYYVDLAQLGDKISVVDFDDEMRTWATPTIITGESHRASLKTAVDKVDSSGMTNIGGGLQQGYGELSKDLTSSYKKAAIFLTDGQNTVDEYANQHLLYKTKGWPIYTVALSDDADKTLLQQIATDTSGKAYEVASAATLQAIYADIASSVGCTSTVLNQSITMTSGQTWTGAPVYITDTNLTTFSASWPGSDVSLQITRPNGKVVKKTDKDVYYYKAASNATYEIYRIYVPNAGNWGVKATASNMAAAGESVNILATTSTVRVATSLSIKIKPNKVNKGGNLVLSGQLTYGNGQGIAGQAVSVKANGKTISKVKTNKLGKFKKRFRASKNTTYKAQYKGNSRYRASNSKAKKVKVKR